MIGKPYKTMQIFSAALLFFLGGVLVDARAAGDVAVSAELSQPEVTAGEMAELQVRVTGVDGAKVPQEIAVDGLQIRLTGQSTQVQMNNFKISSSAVYSYIVMPLRTGKFTIPSVSVRIEGGTMQTKPLSFSVVDVNGIGGSQSPTSAPPSQPGMPGFTQPPRAAAQRSEKTHIAFGEITCLKKSLYAGEMVPVEIRYYFDGRYPVQVGSNVDFESEGLLVERFPDPKQSQVDRDGITYNVLTFRTLISAVKPGVIDVAPAKLKAQIQMPGGMPQGFDNPVFQQMLGGQNPYVQTREITLQTDPLHLEVLPLPREGRPASFAGAVGQFDMDAMVANPKPAPGDPAVLSVKIGGKGNFRAMGSPVLVGTDGWRSYPPADKFDSSDELSLAGVKSFDFTLIAQEQKTNSPGSEFSYFDPVTEKYVTLSSKPLPLAASPSLGANAQSQTVVTQSTPPQGLSPSPGVVAKTGDNDSFPGMTLYSWKSPMQRSEFLVASLSLFVAAAAFGGILHFRNVQMQLGSATTRRRRLATLLAAVNSDSLDAAATYDAALEYVELLKAPESDGILAALTARRDALKYGIGGSVALAREERARLIEALGKLSSQKA